MQDNGCRKSQCHEIIACRTRTTTPDAAQPGSPGSPRCSCCSSTRLLGPWLGPAAAPSAARCCSCAPRFVGSSQAALICVGATRVCLCVCVCPRCCIKHFKLSVKIKRCIAKLTNVASKRAQNALAAHLRVERMLCSALVYKVVNRMCNAHTHTHTRACIVAAHKQHRKCTQNKFKSQAQFVQICYVG